MKYATRRIKRGDFPLIAEAHAHHQLMNVTQYNQTMDTPRHKNGNNKNQAENQFQNFTLKNFWVFS